MGVTVSDKDETKNESNILHCHLHLLIWVNIKKSTGNNAKMFTLHHSNMTTPIW